MRASDRLFGLYRPTGGPLDRLGVGLKYLILLALTIPSAVSGRWWVSAILVLIAAAVLVWSRVGVRRGLGLGWGSVAVLAVIAGAHVLLGTASNGAFVVLNIVLALYATRILTLTTPVPDLLDGLAAAARPLRWVGVNPDTVALAVAVMLRSVPYLIGTFDEVRQAARARGLSRNPLAQVSPVVVRAVGYAQTTGEALAARGLGD